jgi:hypothetical protein
MANGARRETIREVFWRRLIRGQPGSGMSIRAWCRQHSVQEASFYWWRRRLDQQGTDRCGTGGREADRRDADRREPAFVPVRMAENLSASVEPEIEILLAGERRVRVRGPVNRQALADVLAVLTNGTGEAEARSC